MKNAIEEWDQNQDPNYASRTILQLRAKYARNFFQRTRASVAPAHLSAIINFAIQESGANETAIDAIRHQLMTQWHQELHGLHGGCDQTAQVSAVAALSPVEQQIDFFALRA